ncbi:AAA family ATPase [Paraburkholderia terricola]|uniref:ORC1/DEAH AAA+ ATPase domain-containing protein n=1 Tax=Paraburkholderia terricola TaxID=169427 RepID=A0ABU1M0C1_9BURK|nr:hypothetical protein [Paraburkholderia terricola]MDR6449953.1 hypothetical protein [Paraburkholderia terricola]MDR6484595.1 hypothetical protein [Paraburkholderia terricola]
MSLKIPRPVDPSLHPLVTGNYRLATPAIEAFYELVTRCLRYRIMGALIYGPSRVGKTRAIEYVLLLLARQYPKITTYHAQCEHKPRHAEGPFFATLLEAVGDHAPNAGTSSAKRSRLSLRIREAAARSGSNAVLMFLDEAQRFNENEYEWLVLGARCIRRRCPNRMARHRPTRGCFDTTLRRCSMACRAIDLAGP